MYSITYSKQVHKTLTKISTSLARRITARMEQIALDPFANDKNISSMQGMKDYYRLRSGNWRVIYKVEKLILRIAVVKIARRGEAYR